MAIPEEIVPILEPKAASGGLVCAQRLVREAKRWKLSPIDPTHLEKLIAMGLVEMRDDDPVLTNSGLDAIA
jgi:hypothetical protein